MMYSGVGGTYRLGMNFHELGNFEWTLGGSCPSSASQGLRTLVCVCVCVYVCVFVCVPVRICGCELLKSNDFPCNIDES